MENVKTEVNRDTLTLTITIDLTHEGGLSGSGKSRRIASSLGNVVVDDTDGVMMGLNIYRKVS